MTSTDRKVIVAILIVFALSAAVVILASIAHINRLSNVQLPTL